MSVTLLQFFVIFLHIQSHAKTELYYTYIPTDLLFLLTELKNQEWLLSAKNRSKPGQEAAL
jgi:hypothetical protein